MKSLNVLIDSGCVRCKPNSILSSRIYQYILQNGHNITHNLSEADYIIVNTCGSIKFHERISLYLFDKYNKRKRKDTKLISIGCLNRINKDIIKDKVSNVIFIDNPHQLDEFFYNDAAFLSLKEAFITQQKMIDIYPGKDSHHDLSDKIGIKIGRFFYLISNSKLRKRFKMKQILDEGLNENKFYVEIAQGCLCNCSYCIIKKAKGTLQSRPIEHILKDIQTVYEIDKNLCLVADDCGCYGLDIKENIFSLLSAINNKYPTLGIDLCYVNPMWIDKYADKYIEIFKKVKINSINISLQSGSDRLLKLMNRKYSVHNVVNVIKRIKEIAPDTFIWTHLIIGFPGETNQDFLNTLSVIKNFDFSTKFIYSDRKGTKSSLMFPKVPYIVKIYRKNILRCIEIMNFILKKEQSTIVSTGATKVLVRQNKEYENNTCRNRLGAIRRG